jgi:hypothetical protein
MAHHHHHGNCEHEATGSDLDPLEMGIQYSLYTKIDFVNSEILNSENPVKNVFKPFESRLVFDDKVSVLFL